MVNVNNVPSSMRVRTLSRVSVTTLQGIGHGHVREKVTKGIG